MTENKLTEKQLDEKLANKITGKAMNMTINYMFYDINKLTRRASELMSKVILGTATKEDELSLEAVNEILQHHEKGGRISELRNNKYEIKE